MQPSRPSPFSGLWKGFIDHPPSRQAPERSLKIQAEREHTHTFVKGHAWRGEGGGTDVLWKQRIVVDTIQVIKQWHQPARPDRVCACVHAGARGGTCSLCLGLSCVRPAFYYHMCCAHCAWHGKGTWHGKLMEKSLRCTARTKEEKRLTSTVHKSKGTWNLIHTKRGMGVFVAHVMPTALTHCQKLS